MNNSMRTGITLAALLAAFTIGPALAAVSAGPRDGPSTPGATPQSQLTYLMMRDEKVHMTALQTALDMANMQEDSKQAARITTSINKLAAAYRTEKQAVLSGIDALDTDQVSQLLAALTATATPNADLNMDADALARIHAGQYDDAGIKRLVSAYQQTETLSSSAAKLTVEAETSGDKAAMKKARKARDEAAKKRNALLENAS